MTMFPDWNDLPDSLRRSLVKEAGYFCEEGEGGEAAIAIYNHLKDNFAEARRLERQKLAVADLLEAPAPDASVPTEPSVDTSTGRVTAGPYSVAYADGKLTSLTEADAGGTDHPGAIGEDLVVALAEEVVRLNALLSKPSFQARVAPWLQVCFGEAIVKDRNERGLRLMEETSELVQALGLSRQEVFAVVDYVFDRPVGKVPMEIGAVCVSLAALCIGTGHDMDREAETELRRIWGKVDAVRAKHFGKPVISGSMASRVPIPDVLVPLAALLNGMEHQGDSQVLWVDDSGTRRLKVGDIRRVVGRYAMGRKAA